MIRELFTLGNRLSGSKDPRLLRGMGWALLEAIATAAPLALMLVFVREALARTLTWDLVWKLTGLALAAVVARAFFSRAAMSDIFLAAHELMGRARIRLADQLRKLPMGFFTDKRSGSLAGVLTTDIAMVEEIWSHLIGLFTSSFVLPVLVGVGLCFLDWRLGLSLALTMPLAFGVLQLTTPIFLRRVDELLDATADANGRLVEYAQGLAVLRTFGRQGDGHQRLEQALVRLRDALVKAEVIPAPLLGVYGFVVELSFVAVALAGAWLVDAGSLEPMTLFLFLVVSAGVSRQLAELGVAMLVLRGAQKALERIDALNAEPQMPEPAADGVLPTSHDVKFEDVTFSYDDSVQALRGVSLSLPQRKLTAIVGPSGAGKSTLVHLIARLWDVTTGRITIGGVDTRSLTLDQLHHQVSMVFQDVTLFNATAMENLRVGKPDASDEEVYAAARAAQADEFLRALPQGYDTPLGEGGNRLSGGEKQRLSIARAILKNAPVVLLDEATASVDASAEGRIQAAIDALVKDKTVVVIAHRLRTIARADHIVVMDAGRVAEEGTHAQLLAREGLYARLWNQQQRARGWKLRAAPA